MNFLTKVCLQHIFSRIPKGYSCNYFFQRHVTRSLPCSQDKFFDKIACAHKHIQELVRQGGSSRLRQMRFFEFGAGWDLIIPFAYYAFGVSNQTIIDIRQNVRLELVNDTIARFARYRSKINQHFGISKSAKLEPLKSLSTLNQFGIHYHVPVDAQKTSLPSETFDFISSTETLEHISEGEIAGILKECRRLLKPHGIMTCMIDLKDHYSYFDKNLSSYNFLKFSDQIWSKLNPSLHFQNRLRYPDYRRLIQRAGFSIVNEDIEYPNDGDKEVLAHLPISNRFKDKYPLQDLGVKSVWVTLKK